MRKIKADKFLTKYDENYKYLIEDMNQLILKGFNVERREITVLEMWLNETYHKILKYYKDIKIEKTEVDKVIYNITISLYGSAKTKRRNIQIIFKKKK